MLRHCTQFNILFFVSFQSFQVEKLTDEQIAGENIQWHFYKE